MTVVVIAGPLVLYKDNNPIPSRFTLMALICATIGVFCLMITSSWCKERVSITVEKREKFNYFEALKHIIKKQSASGTHFLQPCRYDCSQCGKRTEYLFI